MSTDVYIVLAGELSEGGVVRGVFAQREDAIARALEEKAHFGPWAQKEDGGDQWTSGCDFVRVEMWSVKDRSETEGETVSEKAPCFRCGTLTRGTGVVPVPDGDDLACCPDCVESPELDAALERWMQDRKDPKARP